MVIQSGICSDTNGRLDMFTWGWHGRGSRNILDEIYCWGRLTFQCNEWQNLFSIQEPVYRE